MGAFWNPSGGIVVRDRELSNKEGLDLKQRKRRKLKEGFRRWLENIKGVVMTHFN